MNSRLAGWPRNSQKRWPSTNLPAPRHSRAAKVPVHGAPDDLGDDGEGSEKAWGGKQWLPRPLSASAAACPRRRRGTRPAKPQRVTSADAGMVRPPSKRSRGHPRFNDRRPAVSPLTRQLHETVDAAGTRATAQAHAAQRLTAASGIGPGVAGADRRPVRHRRRQRRRTERDRRRRKPACPTMVRSGCQSRRSSGQARCPGRARPSRRAARRRCGLSGPPHWRPR